MKHKSLAETLPSWLLAVLSLVAAGQHPPYQLLLYKSGVIRGVAKKQKRGYLL